MVHLNEPRHAGHRPSRLGQSASSSPRESVCGLDGTGGNAHSGAGAAEARPHRLHRLWMPVARSLRDSQSRRSGWLEWGGAAILGRGSAAVLSSVSSVVNRCKRQQDFHSELDNYLGEYQDSEPPRSERTRKRPRSIISDGWLEHAVHAEPADELVEPSCAGSRLRIHAEPVSARGIDV